MITFRQSKEFWSVLFFLQRHGTGNIYSRFAMRMFSLPTAILCRYLPSVRCIGAYEDNNLIGLLIYNKVYRKINFLYVKHGYRKEGIGKQMIIKSDCIAVRTCKQSLTFWNNRGFTHRIGRNLFVKEGVYIPTIKPSLPPINPN